MAIPNRSDIDDHRYRRSQIVDIRVPVQTNIDRDFLNAHEPHVDNAAALPFQQATKANTELKGVYNLRDKWVKEAGNRLFIQKRRRGY